jgi:hypothetical protein
VYCREAQRVAHVDFVEGVLSHTKNQPHLASCV